MESIINIHIEKLPEGLYLATSDDIQGLIAQGRTVTETIEIARDVAKKLIEAHTKESGNDKIKVQIQHLSDSFDYPLILGT
jgi:predicted RNase H-like HicB family nuclease